MTLTAQSTVGEVLMHHPKRAHFDDIVLNPKKTWFGHAGPWAHVLDAQDNVILRRHIREKFPDFAAIVNVRGMDFMQLSATVERLRVS